MDTESKTSDRDTSQLSEPPSDLDSSDSDSPIQTKQTEWLATTRKRRSTAGNRMKSMLANEEPDSDLELLFAEDENDEGFSDVDDNGSDVHMDSSSDDEDDNNANDDDMEGEKELERQAKEKKAAQRKRKAQDAIPAKFRKKVRIDPTTTSSTPAPAPAPRPKKKSERASWLPSPADLPTRASSRKTTRISKEQLHQQMVEREARRLKQLAQMEKKAARLEAMKKPPMTQEERLAEAALVEKRNSKSLNRWEEAEKQREEERKAKLAALNQRTLKGPVITFWSGKGQWDDLELRSLRPFVTEVEEKPKKKREKVDKGAAKEKGKGKQKDKENEKTAEKETVKEADKEQADSTVTVSDQGSEKPKSIETAETAKPALIANMDNGKATVAEDNATTVPPKSDADLAKVTELPASAEAPVPVAETALTKPEVSSTTEQNTESKEVKIEALGDTTMSAPDSGAIIESTEAEPSAAVKSEKQDAFASAAATSQPPASTSVLTSVSAPTSESPSHPPSGLAAPLPPPPITSPLAAPAGLSRPPEARPSSVLAAPTLAPPPGIDMNGSIPVEGPKSNVLALPNTQQSTLTPPSIRPPESVPQAELFEPSATAAIVPMDVDTKPTPVDANLPHAQHETAPASKSGSPRDPEAPAVPDPPRDMNATRNGIIYQNFDGNAIRDKNIQTQILFGRKMTKLASKRNSFIPSYNIVTERATNKSNRAFSLANLRHHQ